MEPRRITRSWTRRNGESPSSNIASTSANIPSGSANVLLPRTRFEARASSNTASTSANIPSSSRNILLSTTRFEALKWKKFLDQHRYHVVYRLLWVNRIMGLLRKEYESMNDMIEMLELLLGFEDFTWTNSTSERQYIEVMDSFTSVCKRRDATWSDLYLQKGRSMDLLKEVLRLILISGLPTIYWVDQHFELFLIVGPQCNEDMRVVFKQLLDSWNQHLGETSSGSDLILLPDLPGHRISRETMELAFPRSDNHPEYVCGAALAVFDGIIDQIHQTAGLGLALLPTPIKAYLKLLWQREVHSTMVLPGQQPVMSQNLLKLVLPGLSCTKCKQPKEMAAIFGLRSAIPGQLARHECLNMSAILKELEFMHGAFGKVGGIPPRLQLQTPVLCQQLEDD